MFNTEAVIHSKAKENTKEPYDIATIIHENGNNDVVAEYKGVRYTAIFNPFVGRYYVDDIYGKLTYPKRCPCCGDKLP